MLKVVSGEYELREGRMELEKGVTIGFFNQDLLSQNLQGSLIHVVMQGRMEVYSAEQEMAQIYEKLAVDDSEKLLARLGEIQDEYNRLGGYTLRSDAEEILEGLGFSSVDMEANFGKFSGGWRMRALLAKLLLSKPDLLMLDEPTNHLDLPTIEWLESYLANYDGTFIVVSHDRHFLDNTVNRIAEVSYQRLNHYKGNFSDYLEQKEANDELMARKFANQQDYIKQQMRFIERFRYKASKSTAVQSRIKQLDKMDKIELDEDEKRNFEIRFNIKITPGKQILDINSVSKAFGENVIFEKASAQVYRGDKIAFIGANGKGKSTLLKMIAGAEPYEGSMETGWNVEHSFFAQHQLESLNLKNNLLEEIARAGGQYTDNELRSTLGCFLFSGDDVFKKVKVLSGGEKSRLALAKTLLLQSNFLLLDEPTNHLDMFSTSVLAMGLEEYKGTFIVVSHDRTFLSRVANKIWWIEHGKLLEFVGTYDEYNEYMHKRASNTLQVKDVPPTLVKEPENKTHDLAKPKSKNTYAKLEKDMAEMENAIAQQTKLLAEMDLRMATAEIATNFEKLNEAQLQRTALVQKIDELQQQYDLRLEEWMNMQ